MGMILPNTIQACDIYDSQIKRGRVVIQWEEYYEFYLKQRTWFNFIKQPLHPSQFIPWDMEKNCPLEKPEGYNQWHKDFLITNKDSKVIDWWEQCEKYQQAESEVIFEGFEVHQNHLCFDLNLGEEENTISYCMHDDSWDYNGFKIKSISDLTEKVHIKDKVAKQLKLM